MHHAAILHAKSSETPAFRPALAVESLLRLLTFQPIENDGETRSRYGISANLVGPYPHGEHFATATFPRRLASCL